jgi:hypothetical protein
MVPEIRARRRVTAAAFLVTMALVSGCATTALNMPEVAVRERAQAWLDALMAFDIDGIYSFTSPAYQSAHSAAYYSRNYAGRSMWKTAELGDISCDGAADYGSCKVKVVVTYRGFLMEEDMTTILTETWLQIDDVWYTQPRL